MQEHTMMSLLSATISSHTLATWCPCSCTEEKESGTPLDIVEKKHVAYCVPLGSEWLDAANQEECEQLTHVHALTTHA